MTDDAGGDVHDGEPVFRRGDASDAPAVLHVIEAAFPRWPPFEINVPTIDHLRWKMTPAGLPGNLHGIVELDGEIVAVQVRWQSRVHVRGIEHPCEYSANLSVLPSAQGRGLGSLLRDSEAERQRREPSVGFDTIGTNERAVQMYSARGGERRSLGVWVRALTVRAFLGAHRQGGVPHLAAASVTAATRRARALRSSATRTNDVEVVTAFDDRATALWDAVRHEYDLARVRSASWLNWRYLDPRAGLITAFQLTEGDQLLGYAVVRRDGAHGRVLDLVTEPGAVGAGARLLERGVAELRRAGCTSSSACSRRGTASSRHCAKPDFSRPTRRVQSRSRRRATRRLRTYWRSSPTRQARSTSCSATSITDSLERGRARTDERHRRRPTARFPPGRCPGRARDPARAGFRVPELASV